MMSKMKALAGIMTVMFMETLLAPAHGETLFADQTVNVGSVTASIVGAVGHYLQPSLHQLAYFFRALEAHVKS